MDVDYSPTGREFVAGGYDRSVRIFAHNGGHSREVTLCPCRPPVLLARAAGSMYSSMCWRKLSQSQAVCCSVTASSFSGTCMHAACTPHPFLFLCPPLDVLACSAGSAQCLEVSAKDVQLLISAAWMCTTLRMQHSEDQGQRIMHMHMQALTRLLIFAPPGVPHAAHAARVRGALLGRRQLRLQRLRRHERARLEGARAALGPCLRLQSR